MIFEGDLSRYHPADALMFLSHLNLNGILSIAENDRIITLTFKDGMLQNAHSLQGDRMMMRCLRFQELISAPQSRRIQQIQAETGMSVSQILGQLKWFPLAQIETILQTGVQEVLLELFLLESGAFNFTDTPVDNELPGSCSETSKVVLQASAQSDEFRDFQKSVMSLDRSASLNHHRPGANNLSTDAQIVLKLAGKNFTLRQIIDNAPLGSYRVIKSAQKLLDLGVLELMPFEPDSGSPRKRENEGELPDTLFADYKGALKKLLGAADVLPKIEAIISFCKMYYNGILIITAKGMEVVHCKVISMDRCRGLKQQAITSCRGRIDSDPVFHAVYRSARGFFGKSFSSTLLDGLAVDISEGECALIPILIGSNLSMFLYAHTNRHVTGVTPQHYLELLSWMVMPNIKRPQKTASGPENSLPPVAEQSPVHPQPDPKMEAQSDIRIADLVSRIDDLPSMPSVVSRTLNLLTDPNASIKEIETALGQDQAIVAKLIKVSNSVLYGGLQKVSSLRQAITRLGLKTIKNLVLASSTRSYFLKNRQAMGVWGQILWQHAIECGLGARRIASATGFHDPEEAFIGGVMHDIGKLVLLMISPERFREVQKLCKMRRTDDRSIERQIMGGDHEQIGRLLMNKWNMPEPVKMCVEFHHRYVEADQFAPLVSLVTYADHLSHQYGAHPRELLDDDLKAGLSQKWMEQLNLSEQQHNLLLETIIDDYHNAEVIE